MKGLKIANEVAKMASKKEGEKKPSVVIAIESKGGKPESCPHCGGELSSMESEEGSEE